jgi:pimeloyl-ACP methyl ester carboxylesterase
MRAALQIYYYGSGGGSQSPTLQASNLLLTAIAATTQSWQLTRGNGSQVIVIAKAGSAVDSNPVDEQSYTANAAFGSGSELGTGNFVVYIGSASTFNVTGLTEGTEYHYRAYEFNGSSPLYNTDTAVLNPVKSYSLINSEDIAATTGVSYASTWDPSITALAYDKYFPDNGLANLTPLVVMHGYEETASSIGVANLTRFAQYGYFVIAVDTRHGGGFSGAIDVAGRETFDIDDAVNHAIANNPEINADGRISVLGYSNGGGVAMNLVSRYPDKYQVCVDMFGISDYGVNPSFGWYQQAPSRQATLTTYIGGTPTTKPDEYRARWAYGSIAQNFQGFLYAFHDEDDAAVQVYNSQRVIQSFIDAGRTDYYYNESDSGSTYRWVHAYPSGGNNLQQSEIYWLSRPHSAEVKTIATSGTLNVNGCVITKRFSVFLNDGEYQTAGKSRNAVVTYDTVANSYTINPTIDIAGGYVVVCVVTSGGLVATAAITSQVTLTPASITIAGLTPTQWFRASDGILASGSDARVWVDKTGGRKYQGYALIQQGSSNMPAILPTDLNSHPALEFVAASQEYLQGARRAEFQGAANVTWITVSTGVMINQGQSATNQTQEVLSGGNYFDAVANGANSFGQYAGTNAYLVRVRLYDGSQGTNATKLIARQNKVNQALSFTNNIPTTTESNTSSVQAVGKRSYDAAWFNGKMAEFIVFNSTLSTVNADAVADVLKAYYAI